MKQQNQIKQVRVDKFISEQTAYTRSQIKDLVRQKQVWVNGTPVSSPDYKIIPGKDRVAIGQQEIEFQQAVYLMLNKPQGYVSATTDASQKTVLDLIGEEYAHRKLFPAGRLDKDTEGFILLTDDGDFAHRILSPKRHVAKTYLARIDAPVGQDIVDAFAAGVVFADGTVCLKAELIVESEDRCSVRVVIYEGMYHQIKRMFERYDRKVCWLKRIKIGELELDPTLEFGEYRPITEEEKRLIEQR